MSDRDRLPRLGGLVPLTAVVLLAGPMVFGASPAKAVSSFTVNDTRDLHDADRGDGACRTAGGTCTLRAAIEQGNASGQSATIVVPSGTFVLRARGPGGRRLELAIRADLTVSGAGAGRTIVDGDQTGRVFHVAGRTARIRDLTIRHGVCLEGCATIRGSEGAHDIGGGSGSTVGAR